MILEIVHSTELTYDQSIAETVMEVRAEPQDSATQKVRDFALTVTPKAEIRRYLDGFGNRVHYFNHVAPHDRVEVTGRSVVETMTGGPPELDGFPEDFLYFRSPVLDVPGIRRWASRYATGGLEDRLERLANGINREFDYVPETTDVYTAVDEVLKLGRGVCQDFAHLFIAICRAMGVPARYASGYIHSGVGRVGAGASHAWAEAYVPGRGWLGYDPTNPTRVGENHVRVAVGRDYIDASPTRGTYLGVAVEKMTVTVDTQVHPGLTS